MKWSYNKADNDYTACTQLGDFKIYFSIEAEGEEKTSIICVISDKEITTNYFNIISSLPLRQKEVEELISDLEKEIKEKNIDSFKELTLLTLNKILH